MKVKRNIFCSLEEGYWSVKSFLDLLPPCLYWIEHWRTLYLNTPKKTQTRANLINPPFFSSRKLDFREIAENSHAWVNIMIRHKRIKMYLLREYNSRNTVIEEFSNPMAKQGFSAPWGRKWFLCPLS